jgi:lipopolysaccharide transport system ATP-binding protein
MQEVGHAGRTIFFVSHNMAAIQNLCGRTVVLGHGKIEYDGKTNDGIDRYMATSVVADQGEMDLISHPMRRKGCLPLLKNVRLLCGAGTSKRQFSASEQMKIELTFEPVVPLNDPQFGIGVDDNMGTRIFSMATYLSDVELAPLKQASKVTCFVDQLSLAPGRYNLSLSAGTHHNTLIDAIDNAISFDVVADDFYGNGRVISSGLGKILVRSYWEATPLN